MAEEHSGVEVGTIDWIPLPKSLWSSYTAARLDPDPLAKENGGKQVPWLPSLRRLNVVVGPNNSGKTRLLNELFQHSFREYAHHVPYGFDHRERVWMAVGSGCRPLDRLNLRGIVARA